MSKPDYQKILINKLREIRSSSQVSSKDIAVEHTSEMMEDIQRAGDRELVLTTLSQAWKTSNAVMAALGRIADRTYGLCTACEETINERRLVALPWAEHCIVCQERVEAEPAFAVAA